MWQWLEEYLSLRDLRIDSSKLYADNTVITMGGNNPKSVLSGWICIITADVLICMSQECAIMKLDLRAI